MLPDDARRIHDGDAAIPRPNGPIRGRIRLRLDGETGLAENAQYGQGHHDGGSAAGEGMATTSREFLHPTNRLACCLADGLLLQKRDKLIHAEARVSDEPAQRSAIQLLVQRHRQQKPTARLLHRHV